MFDGAALLLPVGPQEGESRRVLTALAGVALGVHDVSTTKVSWASLEMEPSDMAPMTTKPLDNLGSRLHGGQNSARHEGVERGFSKFLEVKASGLSWKQRRKVWPVPGTAAATKSAQSEPSLG
jgi:hypothetical protein